MIKFENTEVVGWEAAIRCMRNSRRLHSEGDTVVDKGEITVGKNDLLLMKFIRLAPSYQRKFMQMIIVYVDITAPLYWWSEFDAHKIGVVDSYVNVDIDRNIKDNKFTLDDFSHEQLIPEYLKELKQKIETLNNALENYLEGDICPQPDTKEMWWQIMQLLPNSYNQKRTVMVSYETLCNIYYNQYYYSKLIEWCEFYRWIRELPHNELIVPVYKNGGGNK